MPVLEFRCGECQTKSEELVLAGDPASEPICPSCGSPSMKRLLSTFAAQSSAGSSGGQRFDAQTACGGGPCRMPDSCGTGYES